MIDFTGKSILLTGGAGFIGSHIADGLLKLGAKVYVIDNLATGRKSNLENALNQFGSKIEFHNLDIRNKDTFTQFDGKIDLICHQAAMGSVPRSIQSPEDTFEVNVLGFLNMLEFGRRNKIQKIVFASSSSVYGDHSGLPKVESEVGNVLSPYALTKRNNEQYAEMWSKTYAMNIIGLRYFNVFGPRQRPDGPYAAVIPKFIEAIQKGEPVHIHGDGEQTRDFTFVANAVQANIKALSSDLNSNAWNTIYNVAVGQNFSVNYMFNLINKKLGNKGQKEHGPERIGDIRNSLADISKLKQNLDYTPSVSFEEGIDQLIASCI